MSEVTQTPKNENSILGMVKLGLILAVYAVVSCAVLALVNNFTSPKILENSIKKATAAMKEVFVEADDFEKIDDFAPATTNTITLEMVVSIFYSKEQTLHHHLIRFKTTTLPKNYKELIVNTSLLMEFAISHMK